ncbi:MAG: TetR/AcrR family transcriptional regulator [Sedimenticola sp.]|uniref:TetR/AcrR family transcriptional regulator n=1 Tax=Sedimenticola thiotaurini TaxID=1543721 RepID=A0A558DDH1_9GAMM|nr:TetR/AcrR family transcriptional regulator [Sedimenticola sp.]TVT59075.1 MAG: TetR/AcrR family transcriptional regulator [Sedimenticola thiotaurini]
MGKPTETRRAEIILGALSAAADLGLGAATTQAIADRVGIGQSTIFRHYKSRDEIFAAAIESIGANMLRALEPYFSGGDSAAVRLKEMIHAQLIFVSNNRGLPRILFSDSLHIDSPILKQNVQRVMRNYSSRVVQLVQEGIEAGEFDKQLDPTETVRYLMMLIQGLLMRWSLFDFNFDLEAEAAPLWDFFSRILKAE